jgi:hypothetical protein
MKLKFLMDNQGKKKYTLKETPESKEAHYKFIKIRDAPKSDPKKFNKKRKK